MEVLAECEPLLPAVGDPIDALAQLRGIRRAPRTTKSTAAPPVHVVHGSEFTAMWKPLGAAAIDGGIIMGMLLLLVAVTMTFTGAPLSAFRATSAPAFGVMGILLAGCYFVCFAGVAGMTLGERATGMSAAPEDLASHDLHSVAARTLRAVLRDVSCIRALGDTVGRAATEWHTRMQSPTTTV